MSSLPIVFCSNYLIEVVIMRFSKISSLSLLATGFAIGTLAMPAEARRGGTASNSNISSVDIGYDFSIFDTSPEEEPVSCTAFGGGCLFQDVVSGLDVSFLTFVDLASLSSVGIGTSNISLYSQVFPDSSGSNSPEVFPSPFPEDLSLLAQSGAYTITDSTGEPLFATGTGPSSFDPESEEEETFARDFSFFLFDESGTPASELPNDGLENSIEYIVSTVRGETPLPEGYFFASEDGEALAFTPVDDNPPATEVPEPSSVLGFLTLGLLCTGLVRKRTKSEAL